MSVSPFVSWIVLLYTEEYIPKTKKIRNLRFVFGLLGFSLHLDFNLILNGDLLSDVDDAGDDDDNDNDDEYNNNEDNHNEEYQDIN